MGKFTTFLQYLEWPTDRVFWPTVRAFSQERWNHKFHTSSDAHDTADQHVYCLGNWIGRCCQGFWRQIDHKILLDQANPRVTLIKVIKAFNRAIATEYNKSVI